MDHPQRRQHLLALVLSRDAATARPCPDCVQPCGCRKKSPACACTCSIECERLPTSLLGRNTPAIDEAILPIAHSLASVGVYCLVSVPLEDDACLLPQLTFSAEATVYPEYLAAHLVSLREQLSRPWIIQVSPSPEGRFTVFVLASEHAYDDRAQLAEDARIISNHLVASLKRRARAELAEDRPGLGQIEGLTAREAEVLRHYISGHSVAATAEHLSISMYTVRNHLRSISAKMGVSTQAELRSLFALPLAH